MLRRSSQSFLSFRWSSTQFLIWGVAGSKHVGVIKFTGAADSRPGTVQALTARGTVSKTVVRVTVPWVRIPPSPPYN